MDNSRFGLIEKKIAEIVCNIPEESVKGVVNQLLSWDSTDRLLSKAKTLAMIHNPQLKSDLVNLFEIWEKFLPDVSGIALALAFNTSLVTNARNRKANIDLVWTGPESKTFPLRRTDQALLQLIQGARARLLVVSFAVYKIEHMVNALNEAISRKVEVHLILENQEESKGKVSFSGMQSLGKGILHSAHIYIWPQDKRPMTVDGKYGSLHAKLALADNNTLFITSANLTEYAMNLNMEMGIFIEGGELPARVGKHFEDLITQGDLVEIFC